MRTVRLWRLGLAAAVAFLAAAGSGPQARAQDRAKIEVVPIIPHSLGVNSVAFSPDGARVVSGSWDNTLRLWETATGALLRTFEGHSGRVLSVAFSPDGAHVVSGSGDKNIRLWDAATGTLLRTFEGHPSFVISVAFSADGARVLSGSDDKPIRLWDAATGALLHTFEGHSESVFSVAFSRDGARVLSGSGDKTVRLWETATGTLLRTFEGHSDYVSSVAFSPDGARVLSGSGDKTVRLWETATGTLLRTFEGHSDYISSVAFSPDGGRVLSGSWDKTVWLWETATGALLRTFEGHSNIVHSVAFSPDGTNVLSGSGDNTLRLWDATRGALLRTFEGHSHVVHSVAFSPDGARVLSGSGDRTLRLWDAATGALLRTFEGHSSEVLSVAFSPDGARVLSGSGDKTLRLWDATTGALLRTFEGHSSWVTSVAFSPDGARVLSGSGDNTIRLWDAATGALLRTFEGHSDEVLSVAFSSDGARVLSGSGDVLSGNVDNTVRLWDATTGALLRTFEGHSSWVTSVAFSPDGARVLSGSGDKTVRLWETATGALLRTFEGHSDVVRSVAFSPDGARVLSGSWDKTLRLWETATGALLRPFEGHSALVSSVAFSPDGARLLSGSSDTTMRIWHTATGAQRAAFMSGRNGQWLAMTPAGFFAASRKGTEMLSIVHGLEVYSVMQFYDHLHRPDLVAELLKGDALSLYRFAAGRLNLGRILESGPIPKIERLPGRTELKGQTVKMAVKFVDQGGGIGPKVIWRVNGRTQGKDTAPGLGEASMGNNHVVMEQTLTVDPSEKNEIEVIAYNGKGLLATPPLRIPVDDSGPAPKVEYLPDRTELKGQTVKLAVKLIDQGGGIGAKITWRVNGRVQDTAPGLGEPPMLNNHVTMEQTLTVDNASPTEIQVVGYNYKGLFATSPLRLTVDAWGVTVKEKERPKLFILAVGVGQKYLKPFTPLQYAAKDAQVLAETLTAAGREKVEGSPLFSDVWVKTLIEEDVTERNLAAEFDRLSSIVEPRDVFVLFLAGHGVSDPEQGWVFIPQDLNTEAGHRIETHGILDAKLKFWLREKIHAKKTLLIFDACESAAARSLERQTVMSQLEHATGAPILSAAPQGKAAYESSRLGHGVLTYAILEALHRPEGAATNDVTVWEIAKHVSRRVPVLSQREFGVRQIPHFSPGNTEGGGREDFPLGLRTVVLKDAPPPILLVPSHTTTTALHVYKEAGGKGGVVQQLKRNAGVTLLKSERGWAHIAREGKALGYVPARKLQKVE